VRNKTNNIWRSFDTKSGNYFAEISNGKIYFDFSITAHDTEGNSTIFTQSGTYELKIEAFDTKEVNRESHLQADVKYTTFNYNKSITCPKPVVQLSITNNKVWVKKDAPAEYITWNVNNSASGCTVDKYEYNLNGIPVTPSTSKRTSFQINQLLIGKYTLKVRAHSTEVGWGDWTTVNFELIDCYWCIGDIAVTRYPNMHPNGNLNMECGCDKRMIFQLTYQNLATSWGNTATRKVTVFWQKIESTETIKHKIHEENMSLALGQTKNVTLKGIVTSSPGSYLLFVEIDDIQVAIKKVEVHENRGCGVVGSHDITTESLTFHGKDVEAVYVGEKITRIFATVKNEGTQDLNLGHFQLKDKNTVLASVRQITIPKGESKLLIFKTDLTMERENRTFQITYFKECNWEVSKRLGSTMPFSKELKYLEPCGVIATNKNAKIGTVTNVTENTATVSWTLGDAVFADINIRNERTGKIIPILSKTTKTSHQLKNLDPGTSYKFEIRPYARYTPKISGIITEERCADVEKNSLFKTKGNPPSAEGNDYPYRDDTCLNNCDGNGGYCKERSSWDMLRGQCTDFVGWRMNRDAGYTNLTLNKEDYPFTKTMTRNGVTKSLGHAKDWNETLAALGYKVNDTPIKGAIAQWNAKEHGVSDLGHVAYVEEVLPDNKVIISEYNGSSCSYNRRTVSEDEIGRFIHVNINPPTLVTTQLQDNYAQLPSELVFKWDENNLADVADYYLYIRKYAIGTNPSGTDLNGKLEFKVVTGGQKTLSTSVSYQDMAGNLFTFEEGYEYRWVVQAKPKAGGEPVGSEVHSFSITKPEAGVTVIVHGFTPDVIGSSPLPPWTKQMAKAIGKRCGTYPNGTIKATIFEHNYKTGFWDYIEGSNNVNDEIILIYNWVEESDYAFINGWAEAAGDNLFASLIGFGKLNSSPNFKNHNILPQKWHFICHSRGNIVALHTFSRFEHLESTNINGAQIKKIHHYTALDPHPAIPMYDHWATFIENKLYGSAPFQIKLPSNVEYADNYFRQDGSYEFYLDPKTKSYIRVSGQVGGTTSRLLGQSSFLGGALGYGLSSTVAITLDATDLYNGNDFGAFDGIPFYNNPKNNFELCEETLDVGGYGGLAEEHSDTHMWYYATITPNAFTYDGISIPNNWFTSDIGNLKCSRISNQRHSMGFNNSRIVQGNINFDLKTTQTYKTQKPSEFFNGDFSYTNIGDNANIWRVPGWQGHRGYISTELIPLLNLQNNKLHLGSDFVYAHFHLYGNEAWHNVSYIPNKKYLVIDMEIIDKGNLLSNFISPETQYLNVYIGDKNIGSISLKEKREKLYIQYFEIPNGYKDIINQVGFKLSNSEHHITIDNVRFTNIKPALIASYHVKAISSILSNVKISTKQVGKNWTFRGKTDETGNLSFSMLEEIAIGDSIKAEAEGSKTVYLVADAEIVNTKKINLPMIPTATDNITYPKVFILNKEQTLTQPLVNLKATAKNHNQIAVSYNGETKYYSASDSLIDLTLANEGKHYFAVSFLGVDTVTVVKEINFFTTAFYNVTVNSSEEYQDAKIYLNGQFVRDISDVQEKLRLSQGEHELLILKDGYLPYRQTVKEASTINLGLQAKPQIASNGGDTLTIPSQEVGSWRGITIHNLASDTSQVKLDLARENITDFEVKSPTYRFTNIKGFSSNQVSLVIDQIDNLANEKLVLLQKINGIYQKIAVSEWSYDSEIQKLLFSIPNLAQNVTAEYTLVIEKEKLSNPPSFKTKIVMIDGSNDNVNGTTDLGLEICADTTLTNVKLELYADNSKLAETTLPFISNSKQMNVNFSFIPNSTGENTVKLVREFTFDGISYKDTVKRIAKLNFNSFKNEFETRLKLMQADAKKSGNQVLTEEEFYEMARWFAPIPVSIAQQRLTLNNPNAELTLSRAYAILKALYGNRLTLKPLSGSQKVTADMGAFYVTESFRNHQGTYEFATEYDKNLADIQVNTDCETKFIKGKTFDLNLSGILPTDKIYVSSEEIEVKAISSDKLTLLAYEVGMKPITVYVFRNGKYTAKTFFLNIENPSGTDITNNREIPVLDMADMQFWTALDSAGKIADDKGHCILYISKDIQITGSVRIPNGVFLVGSTQNGECITFELDGNLIFEDNTKKGGISNIIIKSANGNGILIKNSNRIFVGASTVDNSRSHGISVINSNDIWIMNNNITNNTGYGIRVDANSEANIFSNIISGNGGDNIYSLSTSSMIGFNPEITLTGSTALERHNEKHPDAIDAGYPNDTYRDADGSIIDAGAENYCNLWKKWYHRGSGSRPTPTLDLKDFPENYTLQQAIDMADKVRKDINSDLIRLLITPDTYDENVTVPAGVWLRGKTGLASDVVINGLDSGIPTVKLYGNSLETRFDGITVIGTVSVENNGLLTIYKSEIQGNINQTGSDELILINNKIHSSNTDGISANGTVTLINNEISNHAGKDISGTDFTAEFNIVHGNTINILAGLETNLETSNISDGIQAGHYRYLDENNQRSSIGLSGGYKFDWRKTNGQKPKTPKAVLVRKEGKLLLRWSQISDNTDITYKVKTANGNITLFETNNTEVEIPYEPDMVFEFYVEAVNKFGHSSKSEIVRKVTDLDLGKGNDLVLVSSETEILDEDTTIHAGEYLPLKVGILNPTSLPSGSFYIFIRTIDYDVSKSGQLIDSIYVANVNPNETLVLEQNIKTSATLSASTKAISIQLAPDGTDNNKLRRDLKVLSPKNGRVEYDISTTIKAYPNPTRGKVVLVDSNNPFTSKDQFKVILMSGKLLNLEPRRIGNEVHFDFSGKPAGMYFIQIIRNDKLYQTMKIVKQ